MNAAVNKLRRALGDGADNPRYIETLPGRGYRFIGTLNVPPSALVDPPKPVPAVVAHQKSRRWWWLIAGAVCLGSLAIAWVLHRSATSTWNPSAVILLADFTNTTQDPVFDGALRQGMAVQLEQSPSLSLLSDDSIQQTLGRMGKAADTRLTPAIAREICQRAGATAVLEGSIATLGSQYVLGLRAKDCGSQRVLAEQQVQAARKEDVLKALTQIASQFRTQIGESLKTVQTHNTPLEEATTSSLEALKAYSMAIEVAATTGPSAAVPLLQRATEIDTQFAMAYARLSHAYGEMSESDLAADAASKAYQLRDRTSEREKLFITIAYHIRVTGDLDKLQQAANTLAEAYPRDPNPHMGLAADVFNFLGKWDKAAEEAARSIALDPGYAIGYPALAGSQLAQGKTALAEQTIKAARERHFDIPDLLIAAYDVQFAKGDNAGLAREAALGHASPETDDLTFWREAGAAAFAGRKQESRRLAQQAVNLAMRTSQRDRAALFEIGEAVWEAMLGDVVAGKQDADAALKLSRNREVEYGAALVLSFAGDAARTQALLRDLETRFPEDTALRVSYGPTLRASLALPRDPAGAIEILQAVAPYESGLSRSTLYAGFGAYYVVYLRGEAFLALHQAPQAAAEFQKILAHPGIVGADPVGALAQLQLARAFAAQGDLERAKAEYQRFLAIWKDADASSPTLLRAKAEFAAL